MRVPNVGGVDGLRTGGVRGGVRRGRDTGTDESLGDSAGASVGVGETGSGLWDPTAFAVSSPAAEDAATAGSAEGPGSVDDAAAVSATVRSLWQ
jgi:hypothetical protein